VTDPKHARVFPTVGGKYRIVIYDHMGAPVHDYTVAEVYDGYQEPAWKPKQATSDVAHVRFR
jgi:hypothetical protein